VAAFAINHRDQEEKLPVEWSGLSLVFQAEVKQIFSGNFSKMGKTSNLKI